MCKLKWTLIAVIAAISLLGYATKAAEVSIEYIDEGSTYIFIDGDTEQGDADKLISALNSVDEKFSNTIRLRGPGGSTGEIERITGIIRDYDITTTVQDFDMCFSACAAIWAGGSERIYNEYSRIGFHWGYTDTSVLKGIKDDYGWNGLRAWLINSTLYLEGRFLQQNPHIDAADYLVALSDTAPHVFWEITLDEAVNIFGATYVN